MALGQTEDRLTGGAQGIEHRGYDIVIPKATRLVLGLICLVFLPKATRLVLGLVKATRLVLGLV